MRAILTPDEKRAADAAADVGVDLLVERAGASVARVALEMLGGGYGRRVTVVRGPGNNGADGRVAARRLRERGVRVTEIDASAMPADLPACDLVIDAAFGSGFRGEFVLPDPHGAPVLAVDVPTGLNAGTGVAAPGTLPATVTVTFGAPSPGHLLNDGPGSSGRLVVADIGLPDVTATIFEVDGGDVAAWVPRRDRSAHKWADGVRVVAGSPGMTGAAHLACAAAMRAGSGMVAVSSPGIDSGAPVEVVDRRVPPFDWADDVLADLHRYHALVLGPGLGREEYTVPSVVRLVLEAVVPTVVDGDGLFALSWNEAGNASFLTEREVPTVLTPHDGEFGTLTGRRPGANRVAAARHLAELTGATVLLKGPTTVVASADRTYLVTTGSERLATAGTGDVLAGIVGAFLARGVRAPEAAAAAAWVHAEAAAQLGDGLVAGDLIPTIGAVIESTQR